MGNRRRKHGTEGDESRGGGDVVRQARLQELIKDEVNMLLRNEVRDPRLAGVEITMVELTGDGASARLWFTSEGNEDKREAYARAERFLRTELAESLGLKRMPELRFKRDPATRRLASGYDPAADHGDTGRG